MYTSVIDSKTTLVALQGLKSANADASRASERLATGLRVNRAGDDPSGVGKAAPLKAELGSYQQVKRSINGALGDMDKVADGLMSISDYLVEMRTLALASVADSDQGARNVYNDAFQALVDGITDIVESVNFGTEAVLNTGNSVDVQIGINAGDQKSVSISAATPAAFSVDALSLTSLTSATSALTAVESAIDIVAGNLARVGGQQRSLEFLSDLADSNILTRSTQYGEIMNADLALEATNLAAAKIRQDSATAVLAQANSMNRNIADYLLNGALG